MDFGSIAIEIVRFFVNEDTDDFVITYKNKRIEKTSLGYEIKDYPKGINLISCIEILLGDSLERIFENDKEGTWLPNWDNFETRFDKFLETRGFRYYLPDPFTIMIEHL